MAFATIDVTKGITGTIPVANGGTGLTSGTTGQFLKFTGSTTLASNAVSEGVTMVDTWYTTATQTISSGAGLQNWSRITGIANSADRSHATIGNAMTMSGNFLFVFPTTGKYLIHFKTYRSGDSNTNYTGIKMMNESGYGLDLSYEHDNGSNPSWHHTSLTNLAFIDVHDTSDNDCRVKFIANSGGSSSYTGGNDTPTKVVFIRLGDT